MNEFVGSGSVDPHDRSGSKCLVFDRVGVQTSAVRKNIEKATRKETARKVPIIYMYTLVDLYSLHVNRERISKKPKHETTKP